MMNQQFLKECKKKEYFKNHRKVLIAVSGGLDSMTLLDCLYRFRKELEIELLIAHVNHKQRFESDEEEEELKNIADKLGVKIFTSSFYGEFSEKKARDFRYQFFKEVMKKENCTALVTAHHADDQAETVFMRIVRGMRLRFLSGMKERQEFAEGELIRPLLHFHKSDFPQILHFEDRSNQEDSYLRNRIRNQYLPLLERENPKFRQALLKLGEEAALWNDAFSYLTKEINGNNLQVFQKQPASVQYFLLQHYLTEFPDLQLSRAQFTEVLNILNNSSCYHHYLKNQYELVKDDKTFAIMKISPKPDFKKRSVLLEYGHTIEFGNYRFSYEKNRQVAEEIQTVPLLNQESVLLRYRQPGDEILLNHQHKKLRRFFINEKIPESERNTAVVVEQAGNILAIAGIVTGDLSKGLKNDIMKSNLYIQKLE